MKTIWLINPYGPIEGENWREYSFNQFGKYLSEHGYNVIWWTASFSHHFKKQRSKVWKDIKINEKFIIRLVPTSEYKKNFGFGRLWKDVIFAKQAMKRFKKVQKPDIIIAYENPMNMGRPSFKFASKNSIPIIYDQMDIWPEFFVGALKRPIRFIANACLKPVYIKRKNIYKRLNGSIALGKHYLEFMQQVSPELTRKPHALVYNGIDVSEFRKKLHGNVNHPKMQVKKAQGEIWCIFAGTLGPSYDIPNIIKCAKRCEKYGYKQIKFFVAGSGPFEEEVLCAEEELNNFVYLGKLLPEDLIPIYGLCNIGLQTYSEGSNVDMPDKFYDYTAAGLAVINSLTGEVSEHIYDCEIGINYKSGNEDSLFNAIEKLLDNDYLLKCSLNSKEIGMRFDKSIQNEKLIRVINQVLDK